MIFPTGPWTTDGGGGSSLDDLAARLPRSRVRGDTARGGCLVCPSKTGAWVRAVGDGQFRVGCFACGDWRGLREALGLTGLQSSWSWTYRVAPSRKPGDAPDMVADADQLDAVYRVILRHLPMTADQRRSALGRDRGLPIELRNRVEALLGPVPHDPATRRHVHDRLVSDLKTVAPMEFLRRVPELERRAWEGLAVLPTRTHAKYFEPWRDEVGRIVALRAYMGRGEEPKYLTSSGRWGPLVHFAFGVPREATASVPWVLTEGWMKAEVLAHHMGCVGVAFSGVSARGAWRRALDVLTRLAPEAPVYIAFDAEIWTSRPEIAVHALELARAVLDTTGRCPGFAVWDARMAPDGSVSPKGIDDAIAAGVEVRLLDRATFGGYLGPALERWEEGRRAA